MAKVFGTIRVTREDKPDLFINLTFTSKKAYLDALDGFDKVKGVKTDPFWGYALYDTGDKAVEDAKFFLGLLPKAANY